MVLKKKSMIEKARKQQALKERGVAKGLKKENSN
jgi:hypothetical protein